MVLKLQLFIVQYLLCIHGAVRLHAARPGPPRPPPGRPGVPVHCLFLARSPYPPAPRLPRVFVSFSVALAAFGVSNGLAPHSSSQKFTYFNRFFSACCFHCFC